MGLSANLNAGISSDRRNLIMLPTEKQRKFTCQRPRIHRHQAQASHTFAPAPGQRWRMPGGLRQTFRHARQCSRSGSQSLAVENKNNRHASGDRSWTPQQGTTPDLAASADRYAKQYFGQGPPCAIAYYATRGGRQIGPERTGQLGSAKFGEPRQTFVLQHRANRYSIRAARRTKGQQL
jgi:hypothetical protein